jgi:hypothetical protein
MQVNFIEVSIRFMDSYKTIGENKLRLRVSLIFAILFR